MPFQDLVELDAQHEVFALHTLQQYTLKHPPHHHQPERFVLTHTDLRGSNIFVDDELRIQAILDWEWAVTVPVAFFTSPVWITASEDRLSEFRSVLASSSSSSSLSVAALQEEWLSTDHDLILHGADLPASRSPC